MDERAEAGKCWQERMLPIVEFASVGVEELGLTLPEALAVLQVAWLQRVAEVFIDDELDEEVQGDEWKRPT